MIERGVCVEKQKVKSEFLEWLKAIAFGVILVWGMQYFLFTPILVQGASMMPSFEDGDRIVVNKIGPKITDYDRFDIVVFNVKEDTNYIKRIIGLPGDHIAYEDDTLYINGKKYDEPYLEEYKKALVDSGSLTEDFTLEEKLGETVVPDGYLFVMGDNRRYSLDSREPSLGFVSMDKVLGTVSMRFYPFENFGLIQ
ncbi:signal peptidase I [Lysinibacillus sp. BW-2-10]|nr:signal peptidase I [Lysinibacillus sp. BW-2-10]